MAAGAGRAARGGDRTARRPGEHGGERRAAGGPRPSGSATTACARGSSSTASVTWGSPPTTAWSCRWSSATGSTACWSPSTTCRRDGFSAEHQSLLEAFAASAATAVATAESVADERRRQRLAAAEAERGRWARELHDETLQALGNLRLILSGVATQRRSGGHGSGRGPGDRAARARHRHAAGADHRAAAGGAGPARARARAAGAHRPHAPRRPRGATPRSSWPTKPGAASARLTGRPGDRHLPPRPGGADQRQQARRGDARERRRGRGRRARAGHGPRRRPRL